jgi:hypothetical protein
MLRNIRMTGLAIAALWAVGALTASSASAVPVCARLPVFELFAPKYTEAPKCVNMNPAGGDATGEWMLLDEWLIGGVAATTSVAVDSSDLLELEDMGTGVKISCEGTDEGTVGSEGKDEETGDTETLLSCLVLAGSTCIKILAVKAVNLPWKTVVSEGRDFAYEGTGGAPGWLVECETILGKVDDTCTTTEGSTALKNLENGTVETLYDGQSGEANCTVGGAKTGLLSGSGTLLTVSGLALAWS